MVLCIGPEGSGKSLLLKKLQNPEYVDNTTTSVPTVGTNISSLRLGDKLYTIREMGGAVAPIWPKYFRDVGKVMFVVDASNLCRISAAGVLLYTALVNPLLKNAKDTILLDISCVGCCLVKAPTSQIPTQWSAADGICEEAHRKIAVLNGQQITPGISKRIFLLVLTKMDASYRQMRNEALLMLQMKRLQKEIRQRLTIVEASAITGLGREGILKWITDA